MRSWVIDDFGRGHSRIDILPKPVPNPNAALEHLDRGTIRQNRCHDQLVIKAGAKCGFF
jgi:hypothetical protein